MSNRKKPQVVEEVPYGCYVWEMPDGKWVGDDDGNFARSTLCMKGDMRAQADLGNLVRSCSRDAYDRGHLRWLSGHRPVNEEEYQEQKARMAAGLVPDQYDLPTVRGEQARLRRQ